MPSASFPHWVFIHPTTGLFLYVEHIICKKAFADEPNYHYLCHMNYLNRQSYSLLLLLSFVLCSIFFSCTTQEERKRYAAFIEHADSLNKADQPLPSDSLLRDAANWYDRHGTANERMRAHYLLGRCYHDMGEAPHALECYQHAAEQADTTREDCDFYTLSTTFYQTAEIFRRQGLFSMEVEQLEKSMHYALLANDTLSAIDHLYYIGVAYLQMKDTTRAISVITQSSNMFKKLGYRKYASQCISGIILPLVDKRKFSEAQQAIAEYEAHSGFFHHGEISSGREIFYYMKGMYYIGVHQYDSALSCFRKELQTGMDYNNQLAAAHGLSILYKELGNADSTAKYAIRAYVLNDSVYSTEIAQHIAQIHSIYNFERMQQIVRQKENTNSRLRLFLLCSFFSIIVIMLITCLLYIDTKKKHSAIERMRKDLKEKVATLENAKQEMSLLTEMLSNRQHLEEHQYEQLQKVIKEKETYIARLRSRISYYQSKINPQSILKQNTWITDSPIISLFHNCAKQPNSKPTDNDWQELFTYIDTQIPEFNSILTVNGSLKESQYKLCYLFRAGLNNTEVKVLLAGEISNTTMACKYLHKKILGREGNAADFRNFLIKIGERN